MNAIGFNVVVRPNKRKTETSSGILIPQTIQTEPNQGVVIAVGSLVDGIKLGSEIVWGQYAGIPFSKAGEDFLILNASPKSEDIIAIIK